MIIHGSHDGKGCSELLVDLFELGMFDGLDEEHPEEDDDKK
jgi:hypothetical protein